MEEEQLEQQNDSQVEHDAESQEDPNPSNDESEPNEESPNASQEDAEGDDTDGEDNAESDSDDEDDDDAMVPLSKLKKVRNEAKNLRDRLKTAEDKVSELEARSADDALMKERDELQGQVDTLTRELQSERLNVHLNATAAESGAIEPAVVAKLVDANTVEWSDDGTPTNLEALVTDLKTAYPKLFSAAQGSGNVGTRSDTRGRDEVLSPSSRLSNAYKK